VTKGYPQFRQPLISPSGQPLRLTLPSEEPVTSPSNISLIGQQFDSSTVPTLLLPRVSVTPRISTNSRDYFATGVADTLLPLEAQRESPLSLASGESVAPGKTNKSQSSALYQMKMRVMMKLTIIGCGCLLVGGIVSFTLLHFITYLIVSWIVLIIIFSNVISQELRSYYWNGLKMTLTTLRMPAIKLSRHPEDKISRHPKDKKVVDVGRNPVFKDIHDTTTYLKALRFLSQDNRESKKW
jgi:hypothetical protein